MYKVYVIGLVSFYVFVKLNLFKLMSLSTVFRASLILYFQTLLAVTCTSQKQVRVTNTPFNTPHFYIVKLGFTGVYIFSYFCSKT